MNTKDILTNLNAIFGDEIAHELFISEICALLKHELSGKEAKFFRQLATQLNNIKIFGRLVNTTDDNERLKGTAEPFYSIHIRQGNLFNIRLLIYIFEDGTAWFLCAFWEKSGKKHSDYSTHIKPMKERFKELLEEEQNGHEETENE